MATVVVGDAFAFGGLTDLDNRWIQARSDLIKITGRP